MNNLLYKLLVKSQTHSSKMKSLYIIFLLITSVSASYEYINGQTKALAPIRGLIGTVIPPNGHVVVLERYGQIIDVSASSVRDWHPFDTTYLVETRTNDDHTTGECTSKDRVSVRFKMIMRNSINSKYVKKVMIEYGRDYDKMLLTLIGPFLQTICLDYSNKDIQLLYNTVIQSRLKTKMQEASDQLEIGVLISAMIISDISIPKEQQEMSNLIVKIETDQRQFNAKIEMDQRQLKATIELKQRELESNITMMIQEAEAKAKVALIEAETAAKIEQINMENEFIKANNTAYTKFQVDMKFAENARGYFGPGIPNSNLYISTNTTPLN